MPDFLERFKRSPRGFKLFLNTYPPYLGAGVRTDFVRDDFREVHVSLRLRWYNRNYVGTQFGGSLYAMVDPFFMLMLIKVLGPDYIVWDKGASIDFVRPGRGPVHAKFLITDAMLAEIHDALTREAKTLPAWPVEITDSQGQLVARVIKTLYVRKKPANSRKVNIVET